MKIYKINCNNIVSSNQGTTNKYRDLRRRVDREQRQVPPGSTGMTILEGPWLLGRRPSSVAWNPSQPLPCELSTLFVHDLATSAQSAVPLSIEWGGALFIQTAFGVLTKVRYGTLRLHVIKAGQGKRDWNHSSFFTSPCSTVPYSAFH